MMHGPEKSDLAILAGKPANKAEQPAPERSAAELNAAELMERRAGTKGNASQQSTCRAQSRISVSQAPDRMRQLLAVWTRGGSRMRESRTYGSVRGACDETHVPTATASVSPLPRSSLILQQQQPISHRTPPRPPRPQAFNSPLPLRAGAPSDTYPAHPGVLSLNIEKDGPAWDGGGMKRREFIALLGAAAAWPVAARAQLPTTSRIGVVMGFKESDPVAQALVAAFRQELQKLGWTQGRNITIDVRYATDDRNQIRALAVELMGLKPDLMVANSNLVTAILQAEVRTVPLLFIGVGDPIGSGFVTNFARPTGNVTGFATNEPSMGSKWLETLREIAPQVEHVGFMLQPEGPANVGFLKAAEAAAPSLKARLTALGVRSADEIERSLSTFAAEPNRGLIIAPTGVTFVNSKLIVELAARYRLPAIYSLSNFPKAGGLISYGPDQVDQFRQ